MHGKENAKEASEKTFEERCATVEMELPIPAILEKDRFGMCLIKSAPGGREGLPGAVCGMRGMLIG